MELVLPSVLYDEPFVLQSTGGFPALRGPMSVESNEPNENYGAVLEVAPASPHFHVLAA